MNKITRYEEELDLGRYLRAALKYKRLIIAAAAAAFVISLIVSLLLPKTYAATASVMPPQQEDPLNSGIVSKLTGGLSGLAGSFIGSKSPSDLWVGILNSRSVREAIVNRFNLRELYKTDTLEDTLRALAKRVSVVKTKDEIISVRVEDRDPARAAQIANAFIEELDRVNKGTVMTSGQRMRAFVEKRLEEAKTELGLIEDSIKEFQKRSKAVKLDEQSKAIIEAIGETKGQLIAKQVELDTMLSYATSAHPKVQLLRSEVTGLSEELRRLEQGKGAGAGKDIFIPTDKIPDLSFQYMRLVRDAKVQETLFELLTQQYEMARIQEAKDSPTVQVLDTAKPAEKKVKPKRLLIVFFSTAAAAAAALIYAFIREFALKNSAFEAADA